MLSLSYVCKIEIHFVDLDYSLFLPSCEGHKTQVSFKKHYFMSGSAVRSQVNFCITVLAQLGHGHFSGDS